MFVVEPGTGKSRGYANAHELGAAIRRGELGPQARIYHRATDRWLPITVHPEYRRAAAEREEMGALTLQQRQWTFLTDAHSEVEPGGRMSDRTAPALIPGDRPPSWFGSTMRRLRGLTHL
jgi:hypothetical protein